MVDDVAQQYIFPPTADFSHNVPHRTSAQLVTLTLVSMFLSVRNWLIPNKIKDESYKTKMQGVPKKNAKEGELG